MPTDSPLLDSHGWLPLPHHLGVSPIGIMTDTLGRAEREAAACLIVRLHHVRKDERWRAFGIRDIGELSRDDVMARKWFEGYAVARCMPDFRWLIDNGYCTSESGYAGACAVTKKFVEAMRPWIQTENRSAGAP